MSTWNHTVLIVVPPALIDAANQLAAAITGNPADAETFGRVWYGVDGAQEYTVANSAFTAETVAALRAGVFPEGAGSLAQYLAIDPVEWDQARICAWVDVDPLAKLYSLGLAPWTQDEL